MKNSLFDVKGMSCSACSAAVSRTVSKLEGVEKADVNLLTNSMSVNFDEALLNEQMIIEAVRNAGYDADIKIHGTNTLKQKKLDKDAKRILVRLIASSVFLCLLMIVSMGHMVGIHLFAHQQLLKGFVEISLLLPVVILNFKYFTSGFKAMLHLNPNMDSLIAVGATASIGFSVWQIINGGADHYYFESAAMILTFITIGKYLESKSKAKTTSAVTKLMDLSPKTSIVLADGIEKEIDSKDIKQGDIVIVKSGMSFPADGVVIKGTGSADESAITGESLPVSKTIGSSITGGTILTSGYVQFEAKKVGEETTLAGIIKLVEEATLTKPKIAKFADRISRIFVPCVILIAVITTLVWYLTSKDFELALNFGISVLVISCPCALGLATPTAIMVGTGKAAEMQILIKSAEVFEAGSKITAVMLDKTGTITTGKPVVTDVITEVSDEVKLMAVCNAIESMSDHPLAQAVVDYTNSDIKLIADEFESVTGKGVSAKVEGEQYYIGNRAFVSKGSISKNLSDNSDRLSIEGKTALYIMKGSQVVGIIGIADTVKESSKEAIRLLNSHKVTTVMLTGDNKKTAESIKAQVGITDVRAELLPSEKNEIIRQYQLDSKVAMVGDGINDSPALAAADVGIALGAGTDIAMESADVVLIRNDLRDVHTTLQLCRKVMKNIKENLFWALIYNTIGIPVAAGVLYNSFGIALSPMLGTIAMSLSSICVISNALRLKRIKRDYEITERKETKKMKTVHIEGMMCPHCSARVTEILKALDENVVVDHTKGTAVISDDADNNTIKSTVEAAGYKVTSIE